MLSQEIYNVTEDRLPRSGFSGKFKTHVNGYSLLLLVMACFRNKTSSPLFLVDESAEKMQFFHSVEISVSCWKAAVTFRLNGFCLFRLKIPEIDVRELSAYENVAWWKFLVDFYFLQIRVDGTFEFLLIKTPKHEYKTCHPKWRKFKYILEFYTTWILSKAK